MKWISVPFVTLAMTAIAPLAQAAARSDCPVPPGAVQVALPSGLPPALRDALPGDIALPGEPFDTTDVYVKGHKHRRYLFVWNIGSRWIVATEIGGIALRAAISTYELRKGGKTAALIDEHFTFLENACAAATKLGLRPFDFVPALGAPGLDFETGEPPHDVTSSCGRRPSRTVKSDRDRENSPVIAFRLLV